MAFRILMIDDNEDDRFFFKRALEKSDLKTEILTLPDSLSGIKAIKDNTFDCIFLDYVLPGMDGLGFLKQIRSEGCDTPVIMLTGQKDEQTVVKLMREGATDYISKSSLSSEALRVSIESAHKLYQSQKEKELTEKALKASETRLAEAQRIAHIGNWEYDFDSKKVVFSDEAYRILEYSPNNDIPSYLKFVKQVHPDDFAILRQCLSGIRENYSYDINFRIHTNDKSLKFINAKGHTVKDENGEINKIIGTIQDITELKNALNDMKKANIKRKATSLVFSVALGIFLISEAVFDPFIDALGTSLLIALSFKGGIALCLKPVELFVEKTMLKKMINY